MNINRTSPRAAALSLALGIAGVLTLVPANEARAEVPYYTNGSGACRATSFAGSNAFYYNHTYIWNGSASTQYLTCVFPSPGPFSETPSVRTEMFWTAGATAGTVTCTAQMAAYAGVNFIASGSTRALPLVAGETFQIIFPSLTRGGTVFPTVNIICSVPPGFKLGVLLNVETD